MYFSIRKRCICNTACRLTLTAVITNVVPQGMQPLEPWTDASCIKCIAATAVGSHSVWEGDALGHCVGIPFA